ncbi:hypothetical protein SAMN04488540_1084 [Ferrimonas sediminum]|uniref:Uncharacterized protein n=1 Tax=Ferrimonas sediminum TaxID=718193 RepID=A0A1G8TJ78_9GAMM|nr:hypothetical protein [Ferrimonas sediminum]SDJ41622.1 hypothetical protein SAMN04488540_1084 [Ferrimonas sediminum]
MSDKSDIPTPVSIELLNDLLEAGNEAFNETFCSDDESENDFDGWLGSDD